MTTPATTDAYRSIWLSLYRTPHTLGYVDAGGYHTRYLEAGDPTKPPLMLLHGTAGSLENFAENIAHYADHFRVIAFDLAGCGWTSKPTEQLFVRDWSNHVVSVMDALGVQRASFVGVSLGSVIAVRLAVEHPDRADRIVMCAPAGVAGDPEKLKATLNDIRTRRLKAADDVSWEEIKDIFRRLFLREDDIIDDLVAARLAIYSEPAMKAAMPHLIVNANDKGGLTDEQWRTLPNRVLAIAAVDAPNMYLDNAYRIGQLAPHAEVLELHGCDHWPQFEQADEFNPRTLDFLTKA